MEDRNDRWNNVLPGVFAGLDEEGSPDVLVQRCPKRVRVFFAGVLLADSCRVRLLYNRGNPPAYHFPRLDVRDAILEPTDHSTECPRRGRARYWTVRVGNSVAENAVWNYHDPPEEIPDISDLLSFYVDAMDAWFEEEEEVIGHPRDPYHRIDVLESSRHVQVRLDDALLADSRRPVMLFETGLPVRYYLPKLDVRMDLMGFREKRTTCPYKGVTSGYWYQAGEAEGEERDLAWCYERPFPEVAKIGGRVAFYGERVDLTVDGELQERPTTAWT